MPSHELPAGPCRRRRKSLRPAARGDRLGGAGKERPGQLEARPIELGVEIVEQDERLAPGRGEERRESGEERQGKEFSFAGRRKTARGGRVHRHLHPIALRPDERLAALALALRDALQRSGDRLGSFERFAR